MCCTRLRMKKRCSKWNTCLKFCGFRLGGRNDNREVYFSSSRAFVLFAIMGTFASLKCQMLASVMCK